MYNDFIRIQKMTHFEYITGHLFPSWVREMKYNFNIWADLMTGNYEGYALSEEDDPYQECYEWFWAYINSDETLSKEFLEELLQLKKDVDSGKVETYPFNPFDDQLWEDTP